MSEYDEDEECPFCGEILEDPDYCYYCGWPNNQGWIGVTDSTRRGIGKIGQTESHTKK